MEEPAAPWTAPYSVEDQPRCSSGVNEGLPMLHFQSCSIAELCGPMYKLPSGAILLQWCRCRLWEVQTMGADRDARIFHIPYQEYLPYQVRVQGDVTSLAILDVQ